VPLQSIRHTAQWVTNVPATIRPSVSHTSSIRTYCKWVSWSFGRTIERSPIPTAMTNRHYVQRTAIEPTNSRYTSTIRLSASNRLINGRSEYRRSDVICRLSPNCRNVGHSCCHLSKRVYFCRIWFCATQNNLLVMMWCIIYRTNSSSHYLLAVKCTCSMQHFVPIVNAACGCKI